MLSMLTCAALPPCPPSFPHPRHLLQTNRITTHEIKKLKKSIHARETHFRPKSTLLFFHFYLQLYASVGLIHEAQKLFDEMPERTLISWTVLMSEYTRHGFADETLRVFQNMLECHSNESLQPDSFVYAVVLRACSLTKDLNYGRQLHCRVVKIDEVVDSYVENALVSMYSSCGSIWDSARVFKGIVRPDLVSWSSLLRGYVQNGLEEEGLRLFAEMIGSGVIPDCTVFSIVIGASANVGWLQSGAQMHCYVIKAGLNSSLFLDNTLINFYVKCGDLDSSMQIFRLMPKTDLVSWNTIIKGYIDNHHNHESLRVFRAMMNEGFNCDTFTLTSILQAVTRVGALDLGREIHGYIIRAGLESDLYVTSSLVDMYIECIDHKRLCSMREVPLKIFINHLKGGQSDEFIIASVLKLCSLQLDLETGKALHSQIIKHDLLSDSYAISSLIDMYSKCEMPEAAQRLFERVEDKGMVPWAAIIAGFCWNGWFRKAVQLFQRMHGDCVVVNEYIYTSVVLACLGLGDLKKAKELHCNIIRSGYGSNISILNTLVSLYSNLWHPQRALRLCSLMPESEIIWSSLIEACVRTKDYETNLKLLQKIQRSYGKLDRTSAYYFLRSCENSVYLNAGTQVQAYLTKRGLISDTISNNSLIKMYSGCGMVTDAVTAFQSMPERNSDSWTAVISANVDNGKPLEAIQLFAEWKNKSPDSSTLISVLKAYAQMGLIDEAFRLFNSMDEHYGIEPSIEHYSCMIEVLGRSGKFINAHDFIDGSIPFKPVPLVWKTLLSASRIHGNMTVAKYAAEKLLELEPRNITANLLLEQILLTAGMWDDASVMTIKNKSMKSNSSWIEIRNIIYEFTSDQIPTADVSVKLVAMELMMEEMGYLADRNHLLHNAEEEVYEGVGLHHTEMKALAFGLLSSPNGTPIRIIKSVRMCGDCHSALKFMSTFLLRELLVRDSCTFHHFRNGKCSCKDRW